MRIPGRASIMGEGASFAGTEVCVGVVLLGLLAVSVAVADGPALVALAAAPAIAVAPEAKACSLLELPAQVVPAPVRSGRAPAQRGPFGWSALRLSLALLGVVLAVGVVVNESSVADVP